MSNKQLQRELTGIIHGAAEGLDPAKDGELITQISGVKTCLSQDDIVGARKLAAYIRGRVGKKGKEAAAGACDRFIVRTSEVLGFLLETPAQSEPDADTQTGSANKGTATKPPDDPPKQPAGDPPSRSTSKKTTAKKRTAKKTTSKKRTAKKTTSKKRTSKKSAPN